MLKFRTKIENVKDYIYSGFLMKYKYLYIVQMSLLYRKQIKFNLYTVPLKLY